MAIDERSTAKYIYAVDLLGCFIPDPVELEAYCDETDAEQIYADLVIHGYQWTGSGWYTEEVVRAQASICQPKVPRRRTSRLSDNERLRQWNAGEPIRSAPPTKKVR